MHIDQSHRPWAIGAGVAFAVSVVAYLLYAWLSAGGNAGSSVLGLIFGVAGYGMMLFAALLGLRKKYPVWRIGRAQTWMRAHLWLGLLSYPLIVLHSAFSWGGSFTRIMMWIFTFVFISGILGAALQHYMPRVMTRTVPMETIYDQIDRIRAQLTAEADKLLEIFTPTLDMFLTPGASDRNLALAAIKVMPGELRMQLQSIYKDTVRPYLEQRAAYGHELNDPKQAELLFHRMATMAPPDLHPVFEDLENICEEKRNLDRQTRLHLVLHGWLLVHIPLSYAVILMGAVHAVVALRF